jgi:hypothetical protein
MTYSEWVEYFVADGFDVGEAEMMAAERIND